MPLLSGFLYFIQIAILVATCIVKYALTVYSIRSPSWSVIAGLNSEMPQFYSVLLDVL